MKKIHPKYYSINAINLYGALTCMALLSASAYFQMFMGMQPCPLCIVQRAMLVIMMVLLLIQLITEHELISRLLAGLTVVAASLGALAAGRQVLLQQLPSDQVPICGPNLDFMLKNLPIRETFRLLLAGSGDCATVQWRFWGVSMPEWTFVAFLACVIVYTINLYRI